MIYRWLFPLLWIVFIVFWIAMARGGKAVAERESVYSRLSHCSRRPMFRSPSWTTALCP